MLGSTVLNSHQANEVKGGVGEFIGTVRMGGVNWFSFCLATSSTPTATRSWVICGPVPVHEVDHSTRQNTATTGALSGWRSPAPALNLFRSRHENDKRKKPSDLRLGVNSYEPRREERLGALHPYATARARISSSSQTISITLAG
jgi:hypothetical protein